ncbi:MAG: hypothetical protein VX438_14785 [Planctomycetota bacterium]|nr:hypothetical protein [Planctomycetota bacterium]
MIPPISFQRFLVGLMITSPLGFSLNSQDQELTPIQDPNGQGPTVEKPVDPNIPEKKTIDSVDLERTVTFTLTLDPEKKSTVEFLGKDQKEVIFSDTNSPKVPQLLNREFSAQKDLEGVVIQVAKNVKYPMVNSLFNNIKSSLDQNKINKPIYIALKDPVSSQNQDEIVTREFVVKHQRAGDLYERISRVGKLLNLELRLDPNRNSITAKGAAKHMEGIQRLLTTLDVQSTDTTGLSKKPNSQPRTPSPREAKSESGSANKTAETRPPRVQPTAPGSRPATGSAPSGLMPTPSNGNSQPVGKFQMASVGNNLFLLDTSTGESWFLNIDGEEMFWSRLPHPTQN